MTTDAPDWQRIITTVIATGDVPDAPDWERIVVGPGGAPVGPAPGGSITTPYFAAGYLAVTMDPITAAGTGSHDDLVLSFTAFSPFESATISHVTAVTISGAATTTNESFIAIYDSGQTTAGTATLLAQTAAGACDVPFRNTGVHIIPFASSVALTGGAFYYVAFMNLGATPQFPVDTAASAATLNPLGLTLPFRWFFTLVGTTPPATVAFSAGTLTTSTWLFYLS